MRASWVSVQLVTLYLAGVSMDPALAGAELFYTVNPIPNSGENVYEFLAVVSPPIRYGGESIATLRLRGRGGPLVGKDGSLLPNDKGIQSVYVSPAEYDSDFGVRISDLADHVPELWRRGGHWKWFIDSVEAFAAREGSVDVPVGHVEDGFELHRYVEVLRRKHAEDSLTDEQETFLRSLPGWQW